MIEQTIFKSVINFLNEENQNTQINEKRLETIGIAVPGTITNNIISKCVNLNIKDYNIVEKLNELFIKYARENNKEELFDEFPINIKLQNDAKCAAIAESKYGVLKGFDSGLFLTLGTGIGGAFIYENKLLLGKQFTGYEFGHIIIDKDGLLCSCGKKGCFEQYASMKKFKKDLKESLNLSEFTSSRQLVDLLKFDIALNKNDQRIKEVIEKFTQNLAIGLSNLINIFEPEIIGIGGSFVYFEEFLLEKTKNKLLGGNLLFNSRNDIIIKPAKLANDAGIIGASEL